MNENTKPVCIERILVSLDSSKHSFAALKIAVALARHFDAKLKGVFVEDITLLSLAEMPFRQEVGQYTAIVREISTDGITRGIFVQSRWIIRTFQKLINQTALQGDFSILRGEVIETIEKESEKCDLLIIGKSGTNPMGRRRLGSTTKAVIRDSQKPILLVEEDNRLGHTIFTLFDSSPLGNIALETSRELLNFGDTLVVLLKEDEPDEFKTNKNELIKWASDHQINLSIQPFQSRSFEKYIQSINGLKTGLFVLPHIKKIPERRIVEISLEKISLPILLIRKEQEDNDPPADE